MTVLDDHMTEILLSPAQVLAAVADIERRSALLALAVRRLETSGEYATGGAVSINAWLREHGLAEERRLSIHGMGHDMVERPLVRDDETMTIEQHMAIVVHPGVLNERLFVHNTDIYLIEANGPGECLHRTPKAIYEIT